MIFLWAFLPIVFILDKIAGKSRKLQNLILLAASLVFYAWGEPRYMWLLLVSILANYVLGLVMDKTQTVGARRTALILGILANLGILGYYKYFNFFINTLNKVAGRELLSMKDIALPLGVSFFTFQAMSYLIDLYKKKYGAQKNILNMALYFAFFPKITQGPIEKYRDFEKQLTERKQSLSLMGEGIRRFVYGLAKKVIIADALGSCVDRIYGLDLANVNGVLAWIAIIFYSLQLYYDFSGYSDMAVGLGKMFGFTLVENFNYPYIASTITDFWRRWHISLTSWFREYLYFSLGGNRKGTARKYLNLLATFAVSGLWHGTGLTFLIWGLLHGLYQVAGAVLEPARTKAYALLHIRRSGRLASVWQCLFTFLLVHTAWVFFRAASVQDALYVLTAQFAGGAPGGALAQVWDIILAGFNAKPLLAAAFAAFLAFSFAACCALDAVRRFSRRSVQGEATPVLLRLGGWRWLCYYAFAGLIFLGYLFNNGYMTGAFIYLYAKF